MKPKSLKKRLIEYAVLGLWNSLVVYAVYTPYVFLWLHFTPDQFVKWLVGGLPMSLGFGWLFVRAVVWAKQKYFP